MNYSNRNRILHLGIIQHQKMVSRAARFDDICYNVCSKVVSRPVLFASFQGIEDRGQRRIYDSKVLCKLA